MSLDKAPRLTIRRVIWILPSDTDAVFVNPINISTNIETAILCVYHSQRQNVLRALHKHAKLSQLKANLMCCYKFNDCAICRSVFGPLHHVLVILIIELSRLGQLA